MANRPLLRNWPRSYQIWQNTANYTAITPLKVTDFGTNRMPIYDLLLVINTNLPPILHHFQVIADEVKFLLATGGRFTLMP